MLTLGSSQRPLILILFATLLALGACTESGSDPGDDVSQDAGATDVGSSSDVETSDTSLDDGTPSEDVGTEDGTADAKAADAAADGQVTDTAIEDTTQDATSSDGAITDAESDASATEDGAEGDAEHEDTAASDAETDGGADGEADSADDDGSSACTSDEDCQAQNSCWVASCDVDTGVCEETQLDEGALCDDGNACSAGDACTADGWCLGLEAVTCSDGNPCTDDLCSPAIGCEFKNNFAACDDGDPCTIGEQCGGGVCSGAQPLCDDGNPCTTDTCDPATSACAFVPDDSAPCDDGSACTEGDACIDGVCTPGPVDACDDENPCTEDVCEAGTCTNSDLDGSGCDDGDACTDGDVCDEDTCVPGAPVVCDDSNPCTENLCDSVEGCSANVLTGAACEDNNACSTESACNAQGQCVTTVELVCDDENSCTENNCSSETGCFFTATIDPCDDGDACTTQDTCQADGSCVGAVVDCDDDNACTEDACDPVEGCGHEDITASCDLGNPCLVYGCNTETGCTEQPNSDPCDDGDVCTGPDVCTEGACLGETVECDDEDPCTADSCDSQDGCQHVAQDVPCDDGDACTQGEACEVTDPFCNGGSEVNQDDGVDCTVDACDPELGVTHTPDASACEIGQACDPIDGCKVGTPILVLSKYSLYPTDPVSSGQGQWIAVTNVGNAFIDLTELYLLNSVSAMALIKAPSGVISDPVYIGPGETVAGLKTPDADPPIAPEPFQFFFASAQDPNFGWDPEDDEIRIVDSQFNTVDSVTVKGVSEGPFTFSNQSPVVLGLATELDQAALASATNQQDNNDALLWCVYEETGATPTSAAPACERSRINEVALAEADGARFVELHLPFGGHTGDLKLRLLGADGGALATLLISDTRMPVGQTLVYTDGVAGVSLPPLTDGAVALLRGDELVDIYGFGTLTGEVDAVVGHPLVEGAPGPAQVEGQSAARLVDGVDSDDNSVDFGVSTPSPGQLNEP